MSDFKKLKAKAFEACQNAYAPYSKFKVGAALLTRQGNVYVGNNIENASYSLGCCAERVAIFNAVSNGEKDFNTLVVIGDTQEAISPCGACRQVMSEFFNEDTKIILTNYKDERLDMTIKDLLPYSFDL